MKSYKEIADSVLKRRDEYFKAKKRRRMSLIKTASSVMGTAAAAFIGLMIYNSSILQDIKPDLHSSHYNATESISTSLAQPTTTDNDEIVTTEIRQTNSEHSYTKTEKPTFTTIASQETKSSAVKKTALTTETKKTAAIETKITYVKTTSVKTETNPAVQTQSVSATEIIDTAPTTAITFVTDDPLGGCIGESPMESGPPGASPIETYTSTVVATAPLLTAAVTNTTTTTSTTVMATTDPTAETEFSNTETATTPISEATFPVETAALYTLYYDKSYTLSLPILAIGNHSVL